MTTMSGLTREQVLEGLREEISRSNPQMNTVTVTERTRLSDLGIDSMETVKAVSRLERRFDTKLDMAKLDDADTVGEVVDLIVVR